MTSAIGWTEIGMGTTTTITTSATYDEDAAIGPGAHSFRHGASVNYDDYWPPLRAGLGRGPAFSTGWVSAVSSLGPSSLPGWYGQKGSINTENIEAFFESPCKFLTLYSI